MPTSFRHKVLRTPTTFLALMGAVLGAAAGISRNTAAAAVGSVEGTLPPNFIVILTDDQGYNDVGCFGSPDIKTPRLDRMAAEGVRLTDFYACAAVCTPSRAGLLTGCYPQRIGMTWFDPIPKGANSHRVLYPRSVIGLNPDETLIPEVLKAKGYATACVGKWHVGDAKAFLPTSQGFDSYFGTPYSNDMKPKILVRGDRPADEKLDNDALTRRYTEEAERFIRDNHDRPFFLYLAHNMPHTPLGVTAAARGKSERGLYGDVIGEIDWSVGKLLDLLNELKIDDRTMVVFTSDNGPWLTQGEDGGSATPLRAGKQTTYEGGSRVPCIVRFPGKIPPGTVCREPAVAFDLLPTFARLAGAPLPEKQIDGKDIWPLLSGQAGAKSPHEAIYFFGENRLNAVRSGQWKLKLETSLQEEEGYGKIDNPQTTIPMKLYNLHRDPGEQKSVMPDHPEIRDRLIKLAEAARKELGDARTGTKGAGVRPIGRVPDSEAASW